MKKLGLILGLVLAGVGVFVPQVLQIHSRSGGSSGALGATLAIDEGRGLAQQNQDPQAIIDKAINALGGEANLNKFKMAAWKAKGTLYTSQEPLDFTGEWYVEPPKRAHFAIHGLVNGSDLNRITVLNGDKGWLSTQGAVTDMNDQELTEAKEGAYALWVSGLTPLKNPAFHLQLTKEVKVNGKSAVGVLVVHRGFRDIVLYFDKESGLLVRYDRQIRDLTNGRDLKEEVTVKDYQQVNGIKYYTKSITRRSSKVFLELERSDLQPKNKLDDALFARP
jgi:hypothetical protein